MLTCDARGFGLLDLLRSQLGREVERHHVLDRGIDRLELREVEQGLIRVLDWWYQVRLERTPS